MSSAGCRDLPASAPGTLAWHCTSRCKRLVGVALSLCAPTGTLLASSSALDRFRREAQAAHRITHPSVVRIHDIGQDGELCFISMEYTAGESWRQRLDREGPPARPELERITLQLCDAVGAAHAAGVVHRDLKPENILLDHSASRISQRCRLLWKSSSPSAPGRSGLRGLAARALCG